METLSLGRINFELHNCQDSDSRDCKMTETHLEEILRIKKNILHNSGVDLHKNPYVRQEVAESWLRSRNRGIDPYAPLLGEKISAEEYQKIRRKKSLLIETTNCLFETFRDLLKTSGYAFYLFDEYGVALLQQGENMKHPRDYYPIIEAAKKEENREYIIGKKVLWHHDLECIVWREDNIGTNAHELSMLLKRPVQLIGPEHYSVALQHLVASAVPIMGEHGEVIATVVLSQPITSPPWDDDFYNLCLHTFGLIKTMAAVIESNIKLKKSHNRLETLNQQLQAVNRRLEATNDRLKIANKKLMVMRDTYETTLAGIDDGIITIDQTGKIIHINPSGARILKVKQEDAKNKNICDYLASQSQLLNLIKYGEVADYVEETIVAGNDEKSYLVSIWPVLNRNNQIETIVLKFVRAERINTLVTNRSGAVARYTFEDIIGESKAIKRAIKTAKKFAGSEENILLVGESGTGKELFAQAIHNYYCPKGPFVAVNCAALPRELIESELFGYEGGSFTGADRHGRPGKIELAEGGTLFLDEIGDMPIELQAVLLRVLEDKQIMRIGGRRYKKVNFRLIAGTNKNLYRMVSEKRFREDLFFRLSVLTIKIPPLRERENDVEILAYYFINKYCNKVGKTAHRLSDAALRIIKEYHWPGNVRQLEHAIIYAVNTAQNGIIEPANLPDIIFNDSCSTELFEATDEKIGLEEDLSMDNIEKKAIIKALIHTNNNVPMAADLLGISKSTIYRKLKKYGIQC